MAVIQQAGGSFRKLRVVPSLRAATDPAGSAAVEHPDKAQHLDLPRRQAGVPLRLASGRPGGMLRRPRLASVPIRSRSGDASQPLLNFASAPA